MRTCSPPVSSSSNIQTILEREGFYLFTGSGDSMWPLIREGVDTLEVHPVKGRLGRKDIALYRSGGRYVAHRVLEVLPGNYLMRGDNCYLRETVKEENVLGVVVSIWRGERRVNMSSLPYRLYSFMMVRCHGPFLKMCKCVKGLSR